MATLKEIANLAKLSTTTISRILNNDSSLSVKEETRNKVLEIAERLEYKGISTKKIIKKYNFTILTNYTKELEFSDPYYLSIRFSIEQECKDNFITYNKIYNNEISNIPIDTHGIIALGQFSQKDITHLKKITPNLVFVDSYVDGIDSVIVDLKEISKIILEYFITCDYKKIGFIGGKDFSQIIDEREKIVLEYAQSKDIISLDDIYIGDFSSLSGYKLTKKMLAKESYPQAIFLANDTIAIGVLKALNEAKISIPKDIALISINDIPASTFTFPALSTVKIYTDLMGSQSVKLLVDKISTERKLPIKIIIPFSLVLRETTF